MRLFARNPSGLPRIPRTLSLRYELAGTHPNASVAFYPETKIGKLVDHIKAKKNVSDIAVYSGDEPLSPTKTFGAYNIGTGATLEALCYSKVLSLR